MSQYIKVNEIMNEIYERNVQIFEDKEQLGPE